MSQHLQKSLVIRDVQTNEVIYGKGAKWAVPAADVLAEHVSRKALAVWNLQPTLEEKLKENEQFELYKELRTYHLHLF